MLGEVLRAQDGVLTIEQARFCGLSQDAVERRVHIGAWRRVGRGVYVAADRDFTDSARVRAAVLSAGERAVLSGPAAAWWHGLTSVPPTQIEVTLPRSRRVVPAPGVRLRRRDLAARDIVHRRGLDVTALPLTAIEAATECGFDVLDTALARHTSLPAVRAAHRRNLGRRGSKKAGRMLEVAGCGARSDGERRLVNILRRNGITGWEANLRVPGAVIDLAFRRRRVAVEVDGFAFHSDARTFRHDRRRQNLLVAAGWTVLRFTWHDLVEDECGVVARIRAAIGEPYPR